MMFAMMNYSMNNGYVLLYVMINIIYFVFFSAFLVPSNTDQQGTSLEQEEINSKKFSY